MVLILSFSFTTQVLDAIAAAEGFSESGRSSKAVLPFSSTLSDDEDDSSDGMDTGNYLCYCCNVS